MANIGPQTRDRAATPELALMCEIRDTLEAIRVVALGNRDDLLEQIRRMKPDPRCAWGSRCELHTGHPGEHRFAALGEVVSRG